MVYINLLLTPFFRIFDRLCIFVLLTVEKHVFSSNIYIKSAAFPSNRTVGRFGTVYSVQKRSLWWLKHAV